MAIFQLAIDNFFHIHKQFPINNYNLQKRNKFGVPLSMQNNILNYKNLLDISQEEAEDIFFEHYWLDNHYDDLTSQLLSNKLFEIAVYISPKVANRFLQKAINEVLEEKVVDEDGIIGLQTSSKISFLLSLDCEKEILNIVNILQRIYYTELVNFRKLDSTFLAICNYSKIIQKNIK